MKKTDVQLRNLYRMKIRGRVTIVDVLSENPGGGWNALDIATRSPVRIGSADRLMCRCDKNGRAIEPDKPPAV